MAQTDGDINIKTKIDTSGVEKDLKSLGTQLKSVSAGLSKSSGIGAGFAAAATAAKQAAKAIKDTSDALNVQIKAEKQLETAAKNNPYLTDSSVSQLKDYASQLQKISTVGDEQIIPFMAQLASSGRTQEEIQNIMSAALDVSASGMMSLDSAVQQLNATYSGNIGQMGRQISELKSLTAEELASGKAIDIVAEKFKGMAQETAAATGSFEQMKNAQGDFNEAVGKLTKPTADLWNNFWKGWYEKGIEQIDKLNNFLDSITIGKTLANRLTSEMSKISDDELRFDFAEDSLDLITDDELRILESYIDGKKNQSAAEKELGKVIDYVNKHRAYAADLDKKAREETEKKEKADKEAAAVEKTRADYINDYNQELQDSLNKLELEAELNGEQVSDQDKLNAYLSAYYDLIKNIGAEDTFSAEKLQELKDFAAGIKEVDTSYDDLLKTIQDYLGEENDAKLSDTIQATIDALELQNQALEENSDAWQANKDKIEELEKLKTKVIDKETKAQTAKTLEQAEKIVSSINDYLTEFSDIVSNIAEIAAKNSEETTNKALSDLSEQYTDGLISYEEYCEQKKQISKQAALAEYNQELWEYRVNVLTATANAALAVLKAYAEGGAAAAALAGVASAASVATVIANRPTMPAFANGGIVGGSNYNDGILARVSSKEMVLTQAQQAQLFAMANGSGGGSNLNLKVINNRGSDTNVGATMTADGLQITVDAIVNKSMVNGNYNKTMQYANNTSKGIRIL